MRTEIGRELAQERRAYLAMERRRRQRELSAGDAIAKQSARERKQCVTNCYAKDANEIFTMLFASTGSQQLGVTSSRQTQSTPHKTSTMTTNDFKQLLNDTIRHPGISGLRLCILCSGPADGVAVLVPNESLGKRIGQPIGKLRVIAYGLCQACAESPGFGDRVEQVLVGIMGVQ